MKWVDEVWTWIDHLVRQGDALSQTILAVALVLGVVLLGSWVQSRIAQ